MYQIRLKLARARVFTLSPRKVPIVLMSDSSQHRMRIGHCFVQLQSLHHGRSALRQKVSRRDAKPAESHITIAQSRISHRVLWIQLYGLPKIADAFIDVRQSRLAHEEVRLEESFVRLLILGVTLLQALCFFMVKRDQQAVQNFGTE